MNNPLKFIMLFSFLVIYLNLNAQDKADSPLIMQQERIKQLIVRLDEKFLRLAESLKEKEPENAKLLLAAFKRSKESLIQLKVDSSINLLKGQDLQKAIDAQQKIIDDLFNILNALTDLDFTNKDEIKRLEELKKKVEKLIKDEFKIKNESSKLENKKQSQEKYAEEIKKLEALIKDSEETLQKTVENRVKGISHLSGIAKNIERQTKITEQIFEVIAGYPIKDKELESKDQKILDNSESKPENNKLASEPGADDLNKSHEQFEKAEKGIMEGKPFSSEKSQKNAIESLKNALKALEKEKNRILSLPENYADELAKNQEKVSEELEKLKNEKEQNNQNNPTAKENSSGGKEQKGKEAEGQENGDEKESGDEGDQNNEQNEGEKPKDNSQTKKNDSFDKAKKYMQESSKNLKEKKIPKAKESQDKSIEELKKIKEEIDKTLAQLRNEEKEEKLAGLENRFLEILQRERIILDETVLLEKIKEKNEWARNEKIKCANISHEQKVLKELVVRAEDILLEDASTIVFPDIVNQLKEDMTVVADFLKLEDTDKLTQSLESEIILSLEEMVEALKKAREDAKQDAQSNKESGASNADSNQLISQSQELKLLRKMQLRVNRMTKLYTEEIANGEGSKAKIDIKTVHEKQKKVLEITRKINERAQQ